MKHIVKSAAAVKIIRLIARSILILLSLFWFTFAFLSGAEQCGGGLVGVIKNSPNALPWAVLFIFVYITFRWELIGSLLIIAMGLFTGWFFNAHESPAVLLLISLPLVILGGVFILCNKLLKRS